MRCSRWDRIDKWLLDADEVLKAEDDLVALIAATDKTEEKECQTSKDSL
jgi:hypothetical protein